MTTDEHIPGHLFGALTEEQRQQALESLGKLMRAGAERRARHTNAKLQLELRIRDLWGSAFDTLDEVIIEAQEIGAAVGQMSAQSASVAVRHVHHALLARGLLTASEIATLLRSGHGHGAYARWRTLFELSAVAEFIKSHGAEAAERYREHYAIETRRHVMARWPELERDPGTVSVETRALFMELNRLREELKEKYGLRFVEDYGWAAKWLPGSPRLGIHQIVEAVDLGNVKIEYRRASYYVHAGGRGALDHHRTGERGTELLWAPSEEQIGRPGRLCGVSLALLTSMCVQACGVESVDRRVWALGALAVKAEIAFRQGHQRWVKETGRNDSEWQE